MKTAILLLTTLLTTQTFAKEIVCSWGKNKVMLSEQGSGWTANYALNSVVNDGADVSVDKSYESDRLLTFSITVDGQINKFEISAERTGGNYYGVIFFDKTWESVVCTKK